MNETLKIAGKQILKDLLSECTEGQQTMFKRMYCHNNLDLPINDAVDQMLDDKIDWAITQCERSVQKNKNYNIEVKREPKDAYNKGFKDAMVKYRE